MQYHLHPLGPLLQAEGRGVGLGYGTCDICLSPHWVCLPSARAQPLFSHIYIFIIINVNFRAPKAQAIFGLHRQCRCQKVCLSHDCVGSIGIYVPLHGLGFLIKFLWKKVKLTVANLLATTVTDATDVTNVTKYCVTTSSRTLV